MRAKRNQARNSITKFKNGEKSKRKRTKKKIKNNKLFFWLRRER
nr:MAG TPA: hypothetical protein [Caudoviricetes sp.]